MSRPSFPLRLPPEPRHVLFHHDTQSKTHLLWIQCLDARRQEPDRYELSETLSSKEFNCGEPSASLTRWVTSFPQNTHFLFTKHLTITNYDNFHIYHLMTILDAMPRLQTLRLCRVNVVDTTNGGFVHSRPQGVPRSLKRLSLEACNITEGHLNAEYDLLFRFLSLFNEIEHLCLLATVIRPEHLPYDCKWEQMQLPVIHQLDAEGFSGYVLRQFLQQVRPFCQLTTLRVSRCFDSWHSIHWVVDMVHAVSTTLTHFAFRLNLEASGTERGAPHELAEALGQCRALRELEFGLYGTDTRNFSMPSTLYRLILSELPSQLSYVSFVIDLANGSVGNMEWARFDEALSGACVSRGSQVRLRIGRLQPRPPSHISWVPPPPVYDAAFWSKHMPLMCNKTSAEVGVYYEGLFAPGNYSAPARLDPDRDTCGLRSMFDL